MNSPSDKEKNNDLQVSFSEKVLRENIGAFVNALLLAKPSGLKKSKWMFYN